MGEIAEIVAAIIAVALLFGAVGGAWLRLYGKVNIHTVRLDQYAVEMSATARILERVSLTVERLEERTKGL